MKFNERKFRYYARLGSPYREWDEKLMNVLREAGNCFPSYENGAHEFLMSVQKEGKYKRSKLFNIVCPCDGSDITVDIIDNMDKEETEMAMNKVIDFVCVMTQHGYIE